MKSNDKVNSTLIKLVIRVPKNQASFLYFTLESNEGLCFYSTLEESLKTSYRDIDIYCTPEFEKDLLSVLNGLKEQVQIETLKHQSVPDQFSIDSL